MCCSALTQIIYGILILVALVLTVAAMFTPGWNEIKEVVKNDTNSLVPKFDFPKQSGILPFSCTQPTKNDNSDSCKEWWEQQPAWLKIVAVAMGIAVVAEVFGFIWNLVTFCLCCCKRWLVHPLIFTSFVASITMLVAVILYYCENKNSIKKYNNFNDIDSNQVSYSFYMAVGGLVASVLSFIAASITQFFANKSL